MLEDQEYNQLDLKDNLRNTQYPTEGRSDRADNTLCLGKMSAMNILDWYYNSPNKQIRLEWLFHRCDSSCDILHFGNSLVSPEMMLFKKEQ